MSDVVALLMDSSNASHKHMGKEDKAQTRETVGKVGVVPLENVFLSAKSAFRCKPAVSDTLSIQAISASKTTIKELLKARTYAIVT